MDVADYVQNITFRLLQPSTPRPSGFRALNNVARKAGIHLEMWMTRLPEDQEDMQRRLTRACKIPRMSTFAIGAIINRAVALMPDNRAYLNVGVWNGFTFLAGMASNPHKLCIGVDNFSHNNSPRTSFLKRFNRARSPKHVFREGDFREYFAAQHKETLGLYLFDGPHTYDDQLDGLTLAEPFFGRGCLVLVDDTNWPQVRQANLDFIARSPFEYRMLLDVQTPRTGHPTYWNGLMLFERGKRKAGAGALHAECNGRTAA
ncbi:MAG: class I SAM-dependent methyltransferase [Planctomycetia bacterium]|nr:class I SAM-dependent methyltransferase [Planctomycetia bacterium]